VRGGQRKVLGERTGERKIFLEKRKKLGDNGKKGNAYEGG